MSSQYSSHIPASMRRALNLPPKVLLPIDKDNLRITVLKRETQKRFWTSPAENSEVENREVEVRGRVQEWDMSAWQHAMQQYWTSLE
jgi:hypothetical protein